MQSMKSAETFIIKTESVFLHSWRCRQHKKETPDLMVNSSTNDPSPVFNKHTKEGVWVEKLTDSLEAVTNRDMSLFLM